MSARHEQWMATYGKVYAHAAEKERRFKIFKDNVNYIGLIQYCRKQTI